MAERGTEVENGWVRSTHFSSECGAVLDGRSNHPRQPCDLWQLGFHTFSTLSVGNLPSLSIFLGKRRSSRRRSGRLFSGWHQPDMRGRSDDVCFRGVKRKSHFRAVRSESDP